MSSVMALPPRSLRELALFAGAGGGLLATTHLLGWRTVAAVEIDPYRREVLLRRQRDGLLDLFPIWDDIRTFDGTEFRGRIDVVTAGFPCQPFSIAGKQRGETDERNLWPETIRVVREVRPRYVFLENVPGLLAGSHGYFGRVLGELAEAGFDAEWIVLGADDVGAPHRRKRLWILATNSECGGNVDERGDAQGEGHQKKTALARTPNVADSDGAGLEGRERRIMPERTGQQPARASDSFNCGDWWHTEPNVGRVADGVAHRVDRLGAIGDGQVPQVTALAWHILTEGN